MRHIGHGRQQCCKSPYTVNEEDLDITIKYLCFAIMSVQQKLLHNTGVEHMQLAKPGMQVIMIAH
jgi:hypothetical protein